MKRSPLYQPKLAWFTAIASAWVFILVLLGAFTTSIGAGMVFLDWPLSNGSLNPDGWLSNLAMFAEHSHRLSAGLMSLLTIGITLAVVLTEARSWLRKLAWFALGLVLAQALLGGLRVLCDHLHIETVNTSVGRIFAMAHACVAQIYVCTLLAITLSLTRGWIEGRGESTRASPPPAWRGLAAFTCALLLVQLAVAAVMRHSFAGLAIPTFPWSTPAGDWLPVDWSFRVGIHFAHRAMAVVISVAILLLALRVARDRSISAGLKLAGSSLVWLIILQITLGAVSVVTHRNPYYTTAHVIVGAITLATCFGVTWWAYRQRIDPVPPTRPAVAEATKAWAGAASS